MKKSLTIQSLLTIIFVFMVSTISLKLFEEREDWLPVSFFVAISFYIGILVYDIENFIAEKKVKTSKVIDMKKKRVLISGMLLVLQQYQ